MKKKISNISLIFITIFAVAIFFVAEISIKLYNDHQDKLRYALRTKVEYAYKRCILEEKCENKTTLANLYQNEYLKQLVHPITKEIIDENITIQKINDEIVINWEL